MFAGDLSLSLLRAMRKSRQIRDRKCRQNIGNKKALLRAAHLLFLLAVIADLEELALIYPNTFSLCRASYLDPFNPERGHSAARATRFSVAFLLIWSCGFASFEKRQVGKWGPSVPSLKDVQRLCP